MRATMFLCVAGLAVTLSILNPCFAADEPVATLVVRADKPSHPISPLLWGIFFEEINFAGDGGLYAERVRNRSFEEPGNTTQWQKITKGTAKVTMSANTTGPVNATNRTSSS